MRDFSENEKGCPVCHSKNMQIVDALLAQSESRGKHEIFHNQLNRSLEPFSVVAEYFGHGMFNKIVIVDEQDETALEVCKKILKYHLTKNVKIFIFILIRKLPQIRDKQLHKQM